MNFSQHVSILLRNDVPGVAIKQQPWNCKARVQSELACSLGQYCAKEWGACCGCSLHGSLVPGLATSPKGAPRDPRLWTLAEAILPSLPMGTAYITQEKTNKPGGGR